MRVNIHQPFDLSMFESSNLESSIKNLFVIVKKLSNSFRKMSISRNLNPEKITIAEEKYKTGAGNMARKRPLSAINVVTLEKLQQQDPAQGIEIYLCCAGSNMKVGNSFDGIIRKSRKQTERVLAYSLQALFEKRTRLISRLKRKSDNLNALMKSRLNARTIH